MPKSWFSYTGTVPTQPSSYTVVVVEIILICVGSASLCGIYALKSASNQPVITTTLLVAISNAVNGNPSTYVLDKGN